MESFTLMVSYQRMFFCCYIFFLSAFNLLISSNVGKAMESEPLFFSKCIVTSSGDSYTVGTFKKKNSDSLLHAVTNDSTFKPFFFYFGVSLGVATMIHPDYGWWLKYYRGTDEKIVFPMADVSVEAAFRVTDVLFVGGEFNFLYASQTLGRDFISSINDASVSLFLLAPFICFSFISSQSYSNPANFFCTLGVGPLFAILKDYFPKDITYLAYGGQMSAKIGMDLNFGSFYRVGLEAGIKAYLSFPYQNSETGTLNFQKRDDLIQSLSASSVVLFFRIVLKLPFH